jgi:hypothetical protein
MRAVIESFNIGTETFDSAFDSVVDVIDVRCDDLVFDRGVRVRSTSSHQSSSVQAVTPESLNHDLRPIGTKKWTLG